MSELGLVLAAAAYAYVCTRIVKSKLVDIRHKLIQLEKGFLICEGRIEILTKGEK